MSCRLVCMVSLVLCVLGCDRREPAAQARAATSTAPPDYAIDPMRPPRRPLGPAKPLPPTPKTLLQPSVSPAPAPRLVLALPADPPPRDGAAASAAVWRGDSMVFLPAPTPPLLLLTPLDDGRVVFFARDAQHGMEPWVMAADGAGAAMIVDLTPGAAPSLPALVEAHGDLICFTLTDRRRYCTDGTAKGTRGLPTPHSWPLEGGVVTLNRIEGGWSLTTEDGAVLIRAPYPSIGDRVALPVTPTLIQALEQERAQAVRVWRGRLYVATAPAGLYTSEVVVSNGTPAGTVAIGPSDGYVSTRCSGDHPDAAEQPYVDHALTGPPQSQRRLLGAAFSIDGAGRVGWTVRSDVDTRCYWSSGASTITADAPETSPPDSLTTQIFSFAAPSGQSLDLLGIRGGLAWVRSAPGLVPRRDAPTDSTLWVTDGSEAGTLKLNAPAPIAMEPRPVLTNAGLVFSMDHPDHGRALFLWPAVPAQGK